jgi:hypothetical protein
VANAIAEAVSDVVETAGTFGRDLLDRAGQGLGGVPAAGPALRATVHWLATVVSAAGDLVATTIKAVVELAAAVVVAAVRLVAGALRSVTGRADDRPRPGRRTFVQGVGEVASSLAGPVLVVAGKALALVQAVLLGQRGERPLTADERSLLRDVFRGSVALYNVRVVDGPAGLFGLNDRPFTLGNTIYMKHFLRDRPGHGPDDYTATLVHECGHVWQNQNVGTRYAVQALWAQYRIEDRYEWTKELARGRARWADFNREAQAQLLMHVWRLGGRGTDTGRGAFYAEDPLGDDLRFTRDGDDHTALARAAVGAVRSARAHRYSRRLHSH